jgi:RNA polymerase sigma-70 factor (ECF subfamily)
VAEQFRSRRRFEANVKLLRAEPSVTDASADLADRDELQRAFRALSIDHRTIVVLHHYLGLSVTEAASNLGIPSGTAKSRLHYAMQALRATLDSDARDRSPGRMPA